MGISPGAWVGLMLGNVPDFVILCLALAKLEAVVVPLDPTTGVRELEMILEAAPLRGLITRPRGRRCVAERRCPTATSGGRAPLPRNVVTARSKHSAFSDSISTSIRPRIS